MYLAKEIDAKLQAVKPSLIGPLQYKHLISSLNRSFKSFRSLKFQHETFDTFGENDYTVSGLYDSSKDTRYVIFNFTSHVDSIDITEQSWEEFSFSISQVIQHESIHQDQYQHRAEEETGTVVDFRYVAGSIDEEKHYLADRDEIDAYGHDIAMEIKYYYPRRNPFDVLRSIGRAKKLSSYNYYKRTYRGDDWSKIQKRLLKKTYEWLPYVQ